MTEWTNEAARIAIETAVNRAFEAGMSAEDIRAEVDHCIEIYEDES